MAEPDKTNTTVVTTGALELARAEYAEAGIYMRHYSSLRFAILPIYFAVVGALGAVATGVAITHSKTLDLPRCAAGAAAMVTLLFFNFERVCEQLLKYFKDRQVALEPALGYKTMTLRPSGFHFIWVSTWLFYLACLLFWIVVAFRGA